MDWCICRHPQESIVGLIGHYFGDATMRTPCGVKGCPCERYTPRKKGK